MTHNEQQRLVLLGAVNWEDVDALQVAGGTLTMGFPCRHGGTPIAGWFILRKILFRGTPMIFVGVSIVMGISHK